MDWRPSKVCGVMEERLWLQFMVLGTKWHRILLTRTPADGPPENHSGKGGIPGNGGIPAAKGFPEGKTRSGHDRRSPKDPPYSSPSAPGMSWIRMIQEKTSDQKWYLFYVICEMCAALWDLGVVHVILEFLDTVKRSVSRQELLDHLCSRPEYGTIILMSCFGLSKKQTLAARSSLTEDFQTEVTTTHNSTT